MLGAEAGLFHDGRIAAIARAPGLALEHVVVVALVVATLEALGAEGHALRDAAGPAAVGHKVSGPDEAAHGGVVVLADVCGEVLVGPPTSDEPLAPVDGVLVVDGFFGMEEVIEQGIEVLRRLRRLRLCRIALGLQEKSCLCTGWLRKQVLSLDYLDIRSCASLSLLN